MVGGRARSGGGQRLARFGVLIPACTSDERERERERVILKLLERPGVRARTLHRMPARPTWPDLVSSASTTVHLDIGRLSQGSTSRPRLPVSSPPVTARSKILCKKKLLPRAGCSPDMTSRGVHRCHSGHTAEQRAGLRKAQHSSAQAITMRQPRGIMSSYRGSATARLHPARRTSYGHGAVFLMLSTSCTSRAREKLARTTC